MARVFSIISGKGGVGKSTTALNLGVALANFGSRPIVIDTSFHSPHLGILLGSPNLPHTIQRCLKRTQNIKHSLYDHPSGMRVIPGSLDITEFEQLDTKNLHKVVDYAKKHASIILMDSSPGLHNDILTVVDQTHEVLLVTTPELPSVTDALRIRSLIKKRGKPIAGVILNKVMGDDIEIAKENVESMLGEKVIGVIPFDSAMRKAVHLRHPIVHTHPNSKSSIAFKQLAAQLLGKQYVYGLEKKKKDSLFSYTLNKVGL